MTGLASLKELLGRRTPGPWNVNYWPAEAGEPERPCIDADPQPGSDADITPLFVADAIANSEENAKAIVQLVNAADELVAVAQSAELVAKCQCRHDRYCEDRRDDLRASLSALNDALEGEGKRD